MIAGRGQKLRVKRTETIRRLLKEIVESPKPEDVVVNVFAPVRQSRRLIDTTSTTPEPPGPRR
jgi:hypothetical protein